MYTLQCFNVSVNNACGSNPCQNQGTCNNGNTYSCSCIKGYSGINCEIGKSSQITNSNIISNLYNFLDQF